MSTKFYFHCKRDENEKITFQFLYYLILCRTVVLNFLFCKSRLTARILFPGHVKKIQTVTLAISHFFEMLNYLLITKALRYKLFFLKALTKRLLKLTIKTKRLSRLKSLSFLNFND
jgi:hypothetical protein